MWYNLTMENFTFKTYSELELINVPVATLAWVGDALFSLCAREWELSLVNAKPVKLNKMATGLVNAHAQAEFLEKLTPFLTETELNVARRAKNSPITTRSKHYSLSEYKRATAFEALLGWVYLLGDKARLNELLKIVFGDRK